MSKLYYGTWEYWLPQLEDESVDLIYIDPPYGKEYISNIPGDKRWKTSDGTSDSKFHEHLMNDTQGGIPWGELAKELYRVAKPDTYFFLHCDIPMLMDIGNDFCVDDQDNELFRYKGRIAWNKGVANGGDPKGAQTRDWEPIIYFCKGAPQFNPAQVWRKYKHSEKDTGEKDFEVKRGKKIKKFRAETRVLTTNERLQWNDRLMECKDWVFSRPTKAEKVKFPTQKPIALAKRVVELTTKPGGVILDCFAGSGTAPLAAKELGREYIAIEADHQWVVKIEERLGITSETQ